MSLIDLLWNSSQDGHINELRTQIDRVRLDSHSQHVTTDELQAENTELKLRVALLVRLLISKDLIAAEDYAALIAETRQN